jgi:hypothetical protein
VHLREAGEFDRDYAGKDDVDLDTSSISVSYLVSIPCADTESWASLFPTAAFIFGVKSKLEPDPNETSVAYIPALIHGREQLTLSRQDPSSAWAGPPPESVTVQFVLYASLTTLLFAGFSPC